MHARPTSTTPADRAARAREALQAAEQRTGARSLSIVPAAEVATTRPVPLPAVDTIISTERPPLPVPVELAPLLPAGLRRGITVQVDGSTSVLLALLSEASRAGSWAAVVGAPSIGLLAAVQAGIDLSRLVLVPAPGAQAAAALAALLDGMDVVVVGPEAALLDADRRRLVARARERASVIVSLRPWPGSHMSLSAERSRWAGLGAGRGRLSSHELTVTRTDRAHGTAYRHTVTLPFVRPGAPGTVSATVPSPSGTGATSRTETTSSVSAVAPAPVAVPAAAAAQVEARPSLAQVG